MSTQHVEPRADLAVVAEPRELASITDDVVVAQNTMPAVRGFGAALQPTSFPELVRLCEYLGKNATDAVPKAYQGKPGAIMVGILAGSELGLSAMKALQGIAVINGVPSLYGKTAHAMVTRHKDFDGIEEWAEGTPEDDNFAFHVILRRRGRADVMRTFSKVDAQRIKVSAGGSNKVALWEKPGPWADGYKQRMCQWRARSLAYADQFPDALLGFGIVEEMIDVTPDNARPAIRPGASRSEAVRQTITQAPQPATSAPDEGSVIVPSTRAANPPATASCVNCSDQRVAHDDATGVCSGEVCSGQNCTFTLEEPGANGLGAPAPAELDAAADEGTPPESGGPITSETPGKIRGTKVDWTTAKTICNLARDKGMTEAELLAIIHEHTGQYVLKQGTSVTAIVSAVRRRKAA